MNGQEMKNLFRALIDDPDQTFFSDQDIANALTYGYQEYVTYIANSCPSIFEKPYDFTLAGVAELDLTGILLGPTPSVDSAYKITKISNTQIGQKPDFSYWLVPCNTLEELWSIGAPGFGYQARWLLQGTKLMFSAQLSGTYRLYYLASPTINWTTAIQSSTSFIDNTLPFQQIIVYFAAQAYAIKDWAENPALERKFQQLLQELDRWIVKGRSGQASRWVQHSKTRNGGTGW